MPPGGCAHSLTQPSSLQVTLWDYVRYGANDFIGEVVIDLAHHVLDDEAEWYQLQPHQDISHLVCLARDPNSITFQFVSFHLCLFLGYISVSVSVSFRDVSIHYVLRLFLTECYSVGKRERPKPPIQPSKLPRRGFMSEKLNTKTKKKEKYAGCMHYAVFFVISPFSVLFFVFVFLL